MKRLQNLSYKTLLTIFIFSLAGIVFFLKIGGKTTKVSAAWWDESWHYRVAVIITNNTGYDATNIPYKATLDTQTLISAGKLQSDADDIRVVDSNGNIVRSQVEKSTLNTTVTKVWFEATVKNSNSATYYIYYGNSTISAPNFTSDIQSFSNTSSSTTIQMKDGFSYSTTNTSGGRLADITKNSVDLGVDGNINYTNSYPGQWWLTSQTQTILNSTGPLFVEVVYSSGATGSYSAYESDVKVFDNGFSETRLFVTYNASGSEQFYYYLPFTNGTRNSVWVNGSGTLIDQAPDSGTLYQADLGQNWFGQRWTATGNYGGTIITKNGSDWYNGYTSAQASYFQTNYSTTLAFTSGSTREVRFGVFAGNGGLTEMAQKGANYGGLSSSINTEEIGGAPIAYWKFDETTGTTAYDSSGANNGTITNATSTTEDQCISGKCLYFNGTASVVIPNNPSLQITGNQTISMWVKPTAIGTRCNPFNKAYGGEGTITLETNGTLTYYWGTAGANGTPYQGFSSNALSSNNWNYVSLVRDITNNKLTWYINGKVNSSGTPSYSQATASTANLILGSGYAGSFTGYIDEVKIYPYARTADQVKQDYNSRGSLSGAGVNLGVKSNTAPTLKSGLVGYWKFDEGQGSSVNNSISGGPNFTLGNGSSSPSWTNEAKSNKSLSFINSSNQYAVSVFDSGILKSTNESGSFTLSAWVKPGTQNGNERIILGRSGCHGGLVATNSNQFGFNIAATDCWTSGLILSSGVIPNWTNWHHVVGVYNNKSVKIYVDGILKNSGTLSGTMSNYGDGMFIGAIGSYAFNGLIDEVKIYNTALNEEQIKQDYNAGSAIQFGATSQTIGGTTTSLDYCIPGDTSYCVPPVAEYNFEENTGTTAKDTSGGNNNGNFSSGSYAPTWSTGKNNTGSGIKFNGESNSSYINTSFPSTPPSSYTAEAWIKPFSTSSSLNPTLGYSILAASYDSTHYPLWITLRDGEITATSFSNAITPVSTLGANIQTNRWYHIAVSAVQNGPAIIYVNGIGKTSFTSSNIAWNSNDKLTIGELRPTRNISFNGIIDQVKIYDYARTPAQIAYDYNRGSPIAWWKLDECQGSITNDSSGVGNTGVIFIGSSGTQNSIGTCQIGTSAAWTNGSSGHSNGSLNFDGIDDYVDMGTTIGNNYSNISVSAWIYPTSGNTGTIIAKNGPFYLGWTSQKARGSIYNGTSWVSTTGNTTLSLNQWHHLLMTYNGTNINVYVDGKYDGTNTTSGSLAVTSAHVQIGGNTAAGFNQYFSGQIDDVRIYNYTLTQEQVKQIYNGGSVSFQ